MKTEPNDSAFHSVVDYEQLSNSAQVQGLTKREYFAAMAMQGLCVSGAFDSRLQLELEKLKSTTTVMITTYAVDLADALITELNRETA